MAAPQIPQLLHSRIPAVPHQCCNEQAPLTSTQPWDCLAAPVLGRLVVLDGGRAVDQETGHLHLAHVVEGCQPAQQPAHWSGIFSWQC